MNKRRIGAYYEEKAALYLRGRGYEIAARNFRCMQGEIDIIAWDHSREKAVLVFVEVKYRSDRRQGYPEEALTYRKQQTIRRVAEFFLVRYKLPEDTPCRFDVLACEGEEVRHWENAF